MTPSPIRLVRFDDERRGVAHYRVSPNQEIDMHILTPEQTRQINGAGSVIATDAFASPSSPPIRMTGPGCIRPVMVTDL